MDFTAGGSRSRRGTGVTFSGRDIVQFDVYIFIKLSTYSRFIRKFYIDIKQIFCKLLVPSPFVRVN
jgi:hypothetical protein